MNLISIFPEKLDGESSVRDEGGVFHDCICLSELEGPFPPAPIVLWQARRSLAAVLRDREREGAEAAGAARSRKAQTR